MLILIAMLEKLIKPGKNSDACIYFDRCRKLRSVAASVYAATGQSLYLRYFLKNPKGIYHHHKRNTKNYDFRKDGKGNALSNACCNFKECYYGVHHGQLHY